MQTVPAHPRATLSIVRASTPQFALGASGGGLEASQADIVHSAPHCWAILADIARMAGEAERAEELIGLAYMAYDILGSTEWEESDHVEDDEVPSDISVTRSSVFA